MKRRALLIGGLTAAAGGSGQPSRGKRPMVKMQIQRGPRGMEPVTVAPRPITDGPPSPLPVTAPTADGYLRRMANLQNNGRFGGHLAMGAFHLRWKAALDSRRPPKYVLRFADRVVVAGGGQWRLFTSDGAALAQGEAGSSELSLDPRAGLFYYVTGASELAGYRLSNGKRAFVSGLDFNDLFATTLIGRAGSRLYIGAVEQEGFAHRPAPPNQSVLQVKEIGSPLEVDDETGELLSVKSERRLLVGSTDIHFAVVRDEMVFAVPGCIFACGPDLSVQRAFSGNLRCRGFSADEIGRLYLLVGEDLPVELWVVSAANGKRELRLPLAPEQRAVVQMPVIGWEHSIFLLTAHWVSAFAPDGKKRWQIAVPGLIGGGVSGDGHILAAAGSELIAIDPSGQLRSIFNFRGSKLQTAPCLVSTGEVMVADESTLYCVAPE